MSEIIFTIEQFNEGYKGRSVKENIDIHGSTMQLLKDNAELAVRAHFQGRGIPRVLRFRQEEIIPIERPLAEHPWYQRLANYSSERPKTDLQIREVIDYFEVAGYIDDLYPFWVTDPFECTISKIDPSDYDNGDGFDSRSYLDCKDPLLVYMDRMCHLDV